MSIYMAGEGRRLFGQTTPSELRDKFQMSVRMPVGVVGAITPWNFPIAIPAWKLAPALVCGQHRRAQAGRGHAAARRALHRAARRGGPAGRASSTSCTATARRRATGSSAIPDVPIITFTGSRETGVLVTKDAADDLKHVHLELGGKNAIIVMDDADLDLAVEGIVWSAFGTSGQRCTAASRVIVHEAVYDELPEAARRARREDADRPRLGSRDRPRPGDQPGGARQDPLATPGSARDEGAKLLTGGEVATDGDLGKGFFYRPTIFGDVEPADADRAGGDLRPDDGADPGQATSTRRSRRERDPLRPLVLDLHARREQGVPRDARPRRPASPTSTPARPAPRCTCRSAARRTPATATARRARPRSTSSRSGSRSTSTTPASSSARRSTTSSRCRTRSTSPRSLRRSTSRSRRGSSATTTATSSGREDARRVRLARPPRHGRLLPRPEGPADDPAPRPRRSSSGRATSTSSRRRRALPRLRGGAEILLIEPDGTPNTGDSGVEAAPEVEL